MAGVWENLPSHSQSTRVGEFPLVAGSTRTACCHKAVYRGNCWDFQWRLRGTGGYSPCRPIAVARNLHEAVNQMAARLRKPPFVASTNR